jgi:hypothetical protein
MTDKWGAEIPVTIVDSKKPDWLRDDAICAIKLFKDWCGLGSFNAAHVWFWCSEITAIKLLANDPYYTQQKPVTVEALKAAAKLAGTACEFKSDTTYHGILLDQHNAANKELKALAHLIMECKPELIAESFDDRTAREWCEMHKVDENGDKLIDLYRKYVRKHIEDSKG